MITLEQYQQACNRFPALLSSLESNETELNECSRIIFDYEQLKIITHDENTSVQLLKQFLEETPQEELIKHWNLLNTI